MPVLSLTLAEMLATVAPLLACCVPRGTEQMQTIKALRLVCKDIASTVGKVVSSASLHLGDKARLTPHQVVRLMMNAEKIESLILVLATTSGGQLVKL